MRIPQQNRPSHARAKGVPKKVRRVLSIVQAALLGVLAASLFVYIGAMMRAELCLQVRIGDEICGYVSSPAVMQEAVARVSTQNAAVLSDTVGIVPTYSFVNRLRVEEELLDTDDCYALLVNYSNTNYENAYALSVGGTFVANLGTREEAQSVVDRLEVLLTQKALEEDGGITSVHFSGLCSIGQVVCEKDAIGSADEVYGLLARTVAEQEAETEEEALPRTAPSEEEEGSDRLTAFTDDSVFLSGSLSEYETLRTPSISGQSADSIEQMLSQIGLSYTTVREVTETVLLPHTVRTEYSDKEYVGTSTVKTVGEDGILEQVWQVEYFMGAEVSRTLLSENVVSEAVEEVVVEGTKEYPRPVPTGKYIWPLDKEWNHISSPFGWRTDPINGEKRYHKGIDIYAPKGCPVYATDGGTVTVAGWDSSRGLYIVIDQGNGLEFYYEHLSKVLVEKGDRVYQGQKIAKVGDTGRATGYHLHYEVHKDGECVNPLKYTKKP